MFTFHFQLQLTQLDIPAPADRQPSPEERLSPTRPKVPINSQDSRSSFPDHDPRTRGSPSRIAESTTSGQRPDAQEIQWRHFRFSVVWRIVVQPTSSIGTRETEPHATRSSQLDSSAVGGRLSDEFGVTGGTIRHGVQPGTEVFMKSN